MSDLKTAATLALEALKYIDDNYMSLPKVGNEAIKALEEALAKQEQRNDSEQLSTECVSVSVGEPVAVIVEKTESSRITGADFGVGCSDGFIKYSYKTAQFYPIGKKTITNFDVTWNEVLEFGTLLYTTPQPSQKPLTDEAIATVYWGATGQSLRRQDNVLAHNFARAIEAAHGIKENT